MYIKLARTFLIKQCFDSTRDDEIYKFCRLANNTSHKIVTELYLDGFQFSRYRSQFVLCNICH